MANSLDMIRAMGLQLQTFDYTSFADDVGIEWQRWLRAFETMMRASRIDDDDWKKDLLLHYAGSSVQQLYETLPELPGKEMRGPLMYVEHYTPNLTSYDEAKVKLNEFFLPKENSMYERHLFRQMKQKSGENIDAFTIRLRVQAERCCFGDKCDENIKDQIVQNCNSPALRRDILKRGDVSLEEVLSTAKVFETVALQEKSFTHGDRLTSQLIDVNKINMVPFGEKVAEPRNIECFRCGFFGHFARDDKCPARGKFCKKCGIKDHFAKKCRRTQMMFKSRRNDHQHERDGKKKFRHSNSETIRKTSSHSVKHVVDETVDTGSEYIFNVTSSDSDCELQCQIGGVLVSAVIDSGSKYNILSQANWEHLKGKKVNVSNQRRETSLMLKAYGGQSLRLIGAFTAVLKVGDASKLVDFYVVDGNGKILIGRDTATSMGVLQITIPVNKIEANKSKLGTIKDVVLDIPIKDDIAPVVQPYRRIPVPLEKLVDKKLNELLEKGVIEQVNKPSRWVSPMVIVPKGDGSDVRICVDMRRANEAIDRENHPLPTIDDFLPHLAKAKVFSHLDVECAFHQVR
ncbi:uncharacterized protein K02A2.6-like [Uranotaenia lowii]|uniref:uncharacterized protein K02A2.6-like n=1 Tax=Uranotaenia lowii TaxID=190385 RepID=UPI00247A7A92|nr:uncharacterized protein K02A2.6-like [Uranotaenia lowii]